jgi:hypothetical protein
MAVPADLDGWRETLRRRFDRKNRELELEGPGAVEVFTVTGWGEIPTHAQLVHDFPGLLPEASHLDRLKRRLERWRLV